MPGRSELGEPGRARTLRVEGTELHYVERGHGAPVVFVHGGLGDLRSWGAQMKSFSHFYRAISYSRRGYYPNLWPSGYSASLMSGQIDDLVSIITEVAQDRAHLVANSYGGYVCLLVAMNRPDLVRTMALAEPPLHPILRTLPGGDKMLADFLETAWRPAQAAFDAGDLEEGVRLFLEGAVGPEAWSGLSQEVRGAMMKNAPEMSLAARTEYDLFMPPITCDDLRKIEAPTLLMRGEQSPRKYYLINDEVARCIPHSEQALIHNAAHVLNNHNPAEHDAVVLDFLERHRDAA